MTGKSLQGEDSRAGSVGEGGQDGRCDSPMQIDMMDCLEGLMPGEMGHHNKVRTKCNHMDGFTIKTSHSVSPQSSVSFLVVHCKLVLGDLCCAYHVIRCSQIGKVRAREWHIHTAQSLVIKFPPHVL